MTINIVLADDHYFVRQGLKTLLESDPQFEVIGEASSGLDTVRVTEQLKPDILICDLTMPNLNGLEVINQVRSRQFHTSIIVLSMHREESYVLQALANGASAYVCKDSNGETLFHAIQEVISGNHYVDIPLSECTLEMYIRKAGELCLDGYETLTPREREIFHLTAEGYTSPEIGQMLFISPRTVEVHRANLMKKLNLRSHTDLICYAFKRGFIPVN